MALSLADIKQSPASSRHSKGSKEPVYKRIPPSEAFKHHQMLRHRLCLANNTASRRAGIRMRPKSPRAGPFGMRKDSSHRSSTSTRSISTTSSAPVCQKAGRDSVVSSCGASKAVSGAGENGQDSETAPLTPGVGGERCGNGVDGMAVEGERRCSASGRPLSRTEIGLTEGVNERIEEWLACICTALPQIEMSQLAFDVLDRGVKVVRSRPSLTEEDVAMEDDDDISPSESASQIGPEEDGSEEEHERKDPFAGPEDFEDGEDSDSEISSGISW